jgi:hypothetical protein
LIVFALGLAVACVVRLVFMIWVYGCIALIAMGVGAWRAIPVRRRSRRPVLMAPA